jgi:hypothetical protein
MRPKTATVCRCENAIPIARGDQFALGDMQHRPVHNERAHERPLSVRDGQQLDFRELHCEIESPIEITARSSESAVLRQGQQKKIN